MNNLDLEIKLRDSLDKLGNTASQVVDVLRAKGIKGERGCSVSCPISKYLISEGFEAAEACETTIAIQCEDFNEAICIDTPGGVSSFIRCFDLTTIYDDLIE